jgi:hypothetical protein
MYDNNASWPSQGRVLPRTVRFTGTVALRKGQGVFYDSDTGTAADADGDRNFKVELASGSAGLLHFAGVTARAYSANAQGQDIQIYEPGSVCHVACLVDTTVNAGLVNCLVGAGTRVSGLFYEKGFMGRGSAIPLQTTTGNVTGSSVDGTAAVAGTTVSKTALFAGAAAGDHVIIMASATTAAAAGATAGQYVISSVTSDDAAELTASAGTGDIAVVVCDPTATVLCKLLDGPPNVVGAVNWVTPLSAAAASPAHVTAGMNLIFGGITVATDSTATLADGTYNNQLVGFECMGTLTTQDYLLTITTGEQLDGATDLATLEYDAADEKSVLEWLVGKWRLKANTGATIA